MNYSELDASQKLILQRSVIQAFEISLEDVSKLLSVLNPEVILSPTGRTYTIERTHCSNVLRHFSDLN